MNPHIESALAWLSLMLIGFAAMLLGACDKEMSRVPLGEPRQDEREVSCTYAGFCLYAGEFGYHTYCDGRQLAVVEIQQWRSTYESGASRVWNDSRTVRTKDSCR